MKYHQCNVIDVIALILVIVGAINWGLIGFFSFDLVATIFGPMSIITRIIYALVGLSGLWMIYAATKCCKTCKTTTGEPTHRV